MINFNGSFLFCTFSKLDLSIFSIFVLCNFEVLKLIYSAQRICRCGGSDRRRNENDRSFGKSDGSKSSYRKGVCSETRQVGFSNERKIEKNERTPTLPSRMVRRVFYFYQIFASGGLIFLTSRMDRFSAKNSIWSKF